MSQRGWGLAGGGTADCGVNCWGHVVLDQHPRPLKSLCSLRGQEPARPSVTSPVGSCRVYTDFLRSGSTVVTFVLRASKMSNMFYQKRQEGKTHVLSV